MTSEVGYRDTQFSRMLLVLGGFIVFGVGVAVGAVFGGGARLGLWIPGALGLSWLLMRTRLRVSVDASGVGVDRASLPWQYIGRVEVLEGDAMRAAITTGAHPSDFIRLRGTTAGMRVWVDDHTDPCRSWVVSIKSPEQLRDALLVLQANGRAHE
jgi:hypothetical protein